MLGKGGGGGGGWGGGVKEVEGWYTAKFTLKFSSVIWEQ